MPTYKISKEESFWHGGKVTKVERAVDTQDVVNAVGTGLDILIASHQKAKAQQVENTVKSAINFLENGDFHQAIKLADELLKNKGKETLLSGYLIRARAFSALNRYQEAIEAYTLLIEVAQSLNQLSEMSFIIWERGLRYMAINELSSAMKDFSSLIKLKPKEDLGYQFLGAALRELGDLEQALLNFNKAIEINPGNASNYQGRGVVYAELKQFTQSLQDYSRAITLAPKNAFTYKLRGDLYAQQEEYQKAIADYSQAISVAPKELQYYKLRAKLYELIGEKGKSKGDLNYVEIGESLRLVYADYLHAAQELSEAGFSRTHKEITAINQKGWGCITVLGFISVMLFLFILSDPVSNIVLALFLLLAVVFAFAVFLGVLDGKKLNKTASGLVAEKESYLPGFADFFEQYLQARKGGHLKSLADETRSLFGTSGPANKALQVYRENYLHGKLVDVVKDKVNLCFSDIRDAVAELREARLIDDVVTAKLAIHQLLQQNTSFKIDKDDVYVLVGLVRNQTINTLDDLLKEMALINELPTHSKSQENVRGLGISHDLTKMPWISLKYSQANLRMIVKATSLIWLGYLVLHMFVNLKAFLGPIYFIEYIDWLHALGMPIRLLFIVRLILFISIVAHIWAALILKRQSQNTRIHNPLAISWSSTTIVLFIVYHLSHFTWGVPFIHSDYIRGDPYYNLVVGLQNPLIVLLYMVSLAVLSFHLYHGTWNLAQDTKPFGISLTSFASPLAWSVAIFLTLGFAVVPISVMLSIITLPW